MPDLPISPKFRPPLDSGFAAAALWNRAYRSLGASIPLAIALERRPHAVFRFGAQPAARVAALGGLRREDLTFPLFELFSDCRGHAVNSPRKLVPWRMRPMPNSSASVCATSANVWRVPRSAPALTRGPAAMMGTYSRE